MTGNLFRVGRAGPPPCCPAAAPRLPPREGNGGGGKWDRLVGETAGRSSGPSPVMLMLRSAREVDRVSTSRPMLLPLRPFEGWFVSGRSEPPPAAVGDTGAAATPAAATAATAGRVSERPAAGVSGGCRVGWPSEMERRRALCEAPDGGGGEGEGKAIGGIRV